MRRAVWTLAVAAAVLSIAGGAMIQAQSAAGAVAEPFKLGTFQIAGKQTVGVVLRDNLIIDVQAANADFMLNPSAATVLLPADMKGIISGYEYGVQRRLYEIVNWAVRSNLVSGANRASWVHDVGKVRTLAPILYPSKILNAAANYYAHAGESSSPEEAKKIEADLRAKRPAYPYLFMKPTLGAVIGNGDDVVLPKGRDRIDWECEIGVVVGKAAKYVTKAQARDYIFGYTISLDMSDRGGRPGETGPSRFGSDWLVGKGHDTFSPMGPFIVPKEFYGDVQNVRQLLTVNGQVMQDARSTDMIHTVNELVEYASMIITLFPGDLISAGSPAGTGMSRTVRAEQIFLKDGDKIVATIDGIGTLTHTARAEAPMAATSSAAR
jgi:2-keto-4-pentenoate hydratase/2-oxohepta-3-ene-1,7-dioic acid hydratase in catechol pathway